MNFPKNDSSTFKEIQRELVVDHINYLNKNLNPLDKKGEEYKSLHYSIDDYNILNSLFDSLVLNTSFKGDLLIDSKVFDDNIGYKVSKMIGNNILSSLTIGNRTKPFSDRVAKEIGEALSSNTRLTSLEIFLDVGELSPLSLCKFLNNANSLLQSISFLKINKDLINLLSENFKFNSILKSIKFFYEPMRYIDLCYTPEVEKDVYNKFADAVQNHSNIIQTDIIPLFENFDMEINKKLTEDVNLMIETLKFSCESNLNRIDSKIEIDKLFNRENNKMNMIM